MWKYRVLFNKEERSTEYARIILTRHCYLKFKHVITDPTFSYQSNLSVLMFLMCFPRNVSINITFRSIEEVTPFNLIQQYFSRNPDSELHFPHCICGPIVQRELKYWNISDDRIASCCWKFYRYFPKYLLVFTLGLSKILLQATTKYTGKSSYNFGRNILPKVWKESFTILLIMMI